MTRLFSSALNLLMVLLLGVSLSGCVTTHLPTATSSPWLAMDLGTQANPLDVAFTDDRHGYLVGSNRMIQETNDGGAQWNERSLDLPEEENFRLISIDFNGDEGWIAGQPGLLMHSNDGGQNWTRLFLDTKLPGEPYLITALGPHSAELATNVGAVYETHDDGGSWDALVTDAAGSVRDLRRSNDGSYVSVSSLGNFYATWQPGDAVWQVHQRVSSQRLQSIGYQPDGSLWMVARGAQIRLNDQPGDLESWSKAIIPITNGYGYMDMAWDPDGSIWAGGGNGTLLVSRDGGDSWEIDPVGDRQPSNFTRLVFEADHAFVLGERGNLLRWVGNAV
ncbi:MAG: photosystem II assembly protein [Cyanobium sp. MED843]|nr:photosystem II assembly protein [Cyanobium sp. MED843]OUW28343.1 MAG: photosystem II assembly protein [Cyanobacteria bacterium TMED177]